MASRSPSAVDSAAARPPAATRPEITYGRPAISGVESTITSVLMTKSCSRTTPGWPAIALQAATMASTLAAFFPQIWIRPSSPQREQPGPDGREVPADDVGVDLELRERRIGRRREVQQEDEQQRPRHRLARFTHARRGEVAHQDVRQRGGADHHAEDDREEVQRAVVDERLDMRLERRQRRQPGLQPSSCSRAVISAMARP